MTGHAYYSPLETTLAAAVDALPGDGQDREHPEATCNRCNRANVSWVAPSPLWNEVMRGGDIDAADDFSGIVCPTCFALLAEQRGVALGWRLYATGVLAALKTVTPSGRHWDEEAWLWVDQGGSQARPEDSASRVTEADHG